MRNSQANTEKIFTKFFWRAGKVTSCEKSVTPKKTSTKEFCHKLLWYHRAIWEVSLVGLEVLVNSSLLIFGGEALLPFYLRAEYPKAIALQCFFCFKAAPWIWGAKMSHLKFKGFGLTGVFALQTENGPPIRVFLALGFWEPLQRRTQKRNSKRSRYTIDPRVLKHCRASEHLQSIGVKKSHSLPWESALFVYQATTSQPRRWAKSDAKATPNQRWTDAKIDVDAK